MLLQKNIWICWFQGIENAPDIVKKCYDSVKRNMPDSNITVITKHKDILKCIEKDSSEAENNSRRKTITKYIIVKMAIHK